MSQQIIETSCGECFVRINAYGDDYRAVTVGILSSHMPLERSRWFGFNGRLGAAWRALKGMDDATFEFLYRGEAEDFLSGVRRAVDEAFSGQEGA